MSPEHKTRVWRDWVGVQWVCTCGRSSLVVRTMNRAAVERSALRHETRANRRNARRAR